MTMHSVNPEVKNMSDETSTALDNPSFVIAFDDLDNATFWAPPGAIYQVDAPDAVKEVSAITYVQGLASNCYCKDGFVWCCKVIGGIRVCWKTSQSC